MATNFHFDLPFHSLKKQFGHDIIKFKDAIRKMRFTAGLYDGTMVKFLIGLNQVFPEAVPIKKTFLYPGHSGVMVKDVAETPAPSGPVPDTLYTWVDENGTPVQTEGRANFYDHRPKFKATKKALEK